MGCFGGGGGGAACERPLARRGAAAHCRTLESKGPLRLRGRRSAWQFWGASRAPARCASTKRPPVPHLSLQLLLLRPGTSCATVAHARSPYRSTAMRSRSSSCGGGVGPIGFSSSRGACISHGGAGSCGASWAPGGRFRGLAIGWFRLSSMEPSIAAWVPSRDAQARRKLMPAPSPAPSRLNGTESCSAA